MTSSSSAATAQSTPVTVSWYTLLALPLALSWRVYLANRMPIMDCDEVYNYWEPLHYLLYGSGLQTWEYAHGYALRTYAYLIPLVGVTKVYQFGLLWGQRLLGTTTVTAVLQTVVSGLVDNTDTMLDVATVSPALILFVLLRCSLAATMAYAEVSFCRALEETRLVAPRVARWTLLTLQASAGLAHAAGALLPSTTWTVAWLLAATCFVRKQTRGFVALAVHATLVIGWPFGVIVLVPLGLHVLLVQTQPQQEEEEASTAGWGSSEHVQGVKRLLMFTVLVTTIAQDTVMVIDHFYYGIWTSPSLNIFRYNAQGGGDELYGVEPTSYYVKNLLLNFNGVAVLGVLSLVAVVGIGPWIGYRNRTSLIMLAVLLSPLYVWFAIVVPRPHKEERFLFPIYPALCFGAVLTLDIAQGCIFRILDKLSLLSTFGTPIHRSILHGVVLIPMAALSMLRILALQKYYTAPFSIYAALHASSKDSGASTLQTKQLVCTCGEWYRFPSSFMLPANHELAFLRSSFTGQLPQPFSEHGSLPRSEDVLQPFNDMNQDEPTRYSRIQDCAYVIDLMESSDCQVPETASLVATAPFLDADKTTSTLHRTLYIPRLHEKAITEGAVHYQNYVLHKL